MYAIYGNIYHQYTPFLLAYIPCMDPMGHESKKTKSADVSDEIPACQDVQVQFFPGAEKISAGP